MCFGSTLWVVVVDRLMLIVKPRVSTGNALYSGQFREKGATVHIWSGSCFKDLETLCNYALFPEIPERELFLSSFSTTFKGEDMAVRIFGNLTPSVTGWFRFLLESNGFTELWLSTGKNQHTLVSRVLADTEKLTSEISEKVFLTKNKIYVFDLLYLSTQNSSSATLLWQFPGKNDSFKIISKENISRYPFNISKNVTKPRVCKGCIPPCLACKLYSSKNKNHFLSERKNNKLYLNFSEVRRALRVCPYAPSYNTPRISRWEGVHHYFRPTHIFPWPKHDEIAEKKHWFPMNKTHADKMVGVFMNHLENAYPR